MAMWTDGRAVVIATGWGIARSEGDEHEVHRFAREGRRRDEDPPAICAFAVTDERGDEAVFGTGRQLSIWRRGHGVVPCETGGRDVHALAGANAGALACVVADGDRLVVVRGKLDGDRLALGDRISLGKVPRIAPVASFFTRGERKPWIEDRGADGDDDAAGFDPASLSVGPKFPGRVCLHANRFGIAVTSTYSGIVAVLDGATLTPRLRVRVPTEHEQYDIYALPMPAGVVVTAVANHRDTLYLYIDDAGRVVATRDKLGKELAYGADGPGIAWSGSRAVVAQEHGGDDELHALELPELTAKRFGRNEGYAIDHASTADGTVHVLAMTTHSHERPHNWRLERHELAKKTKVSELTMPDFRPPPEPVDLSAPLVTGAASLGVAVDAATVWRVRTGETTTLRLNVVNAGGAAAGLWIEVSGDAVAHGHVVPLRAEIAGTPAALAGSGTLRAELPQARLAAAQVVEKNVRKADIPPRPSLELELELRGERVGKALLMVRVGARGAAGTSGSALLGRSIDVG